jgi:hypothetical protein
MRLLVMVSLAIKVRDQFIFQIFMTILGMVFKTVLTHTLLMPVTTIGGTLLVLLPSAQAMVSIGTRYAAARLKYAGRFMMCKLIPGLVLQQ